MRWNASLSSDLISSITQTLSCVCVKPRRLPPGHVSPHGLFGSAVCFEHVCVDMFDQVHLRRRGIVVLRYGEPQKQVLPVPPHVPSYFPLLKFISRGISDARSERTPFQSVLIVSQSVNTISSYCVVNLQPLKKRKLNSRICFTDISGSDVFVPLWQLEESCVLSRMLTIKFLETRAGTGVGDACGHVRL